MSLGDTYTNFLEIGSGGGGTVYKAYHLRMKKYVVLKKIHTEIRNFTDIRRELDILKNLRHTYLPTVLDFIEDSGAIYTVMDYIAGESFETLLKQGKRFTEKQVNKYALQLAEVLSYLHHQKYPIIHGDIKPANIMLTPDDHICLIDFNISQLRNHINGQNLGYTRGYAAPEQIEMIQLASQYLYRNRTAGKGGGADKENDKTELLDETTNNKLKNIMDVRIDIYSAGAALYTIMSGKKPDMDFKHIQPIDQIVDCQEGLAYVINTCMQIDPKDRFQTADDFFKAVSNIVKIDKRYKAFVLRQTISIIVCMIGLTFSVLLCVFGIETMKREKRNNYLNIVNQMEESNMENSTLEMFEKLYKSAIAINDKYPEAYVQMSQYLYIHMKYEDLINYLNNEVLNHSSDYDEESLGNFYSLLAAGYCELGDNKLANLYYSTALKYNPFHCDIYSDYAISLAESGDLEQAESILETAIDMGLSNDRMLLTVGEIKGKSGQKEEAEKNFVSCIEETEDDYILLRAYIMWSRLYDNGEETDLIKKAEILKKAYDVVSETYHTMIIEQLAQIYIDLGDLTQDINYYEKAIKCLNEIIRLGWDSYITYNNIGILYEEMGMFDNAQDIFLKMISSYGEDYRTYKRLAFLEVDMQNEKEASERSYLSFQQYYQKARKLFDTSGEQNDVDMEMQRLEQLYQEMKDKDWLP